MICMSKIPISTLCNLQITLLKEYIRKSYFMQVSDNQAVSYALGVWFKSGKKLELKQSPLVKVQIRHIAVMPDVHLKLVELSEETGFTLCELASAIVNVVAKQLFQADLYFKFSGNEVES